jgi:uncharacterized protein YegP (UPF0339 family)
MAAGTLHVYRSRSVFRGEKWRWRLVAGNGAVLAVSSEGYANRGECADMAMQVTNGNYREADLVVEGTAYDRP